MEKYYRFILLTMKRHLKYLEIEKKQQASALYVMVEQNIIKKNKFIKINDEMEGD